MTSPFKTEITLEGELSSQAAREKWEQTSLEVGKKVNKRKKKRGSPLFVHSKYKGKYVLYYYHNYGGDFCDTMFTGEIFEYDEGKCQVTGFVTASTSLRRFAVALFALAAPLALGFTLLVYYIAPFLEVAPLLSEGFEHNIGLVFVGAVAAVAAIAVLCLFVDNRRVKSILDYLNEFLKEESNS